MNTIKEKINSLMPSVAYLVTEFKDEGLGGKAFFMLQNVLYNASTVAERHMDRIELAHKFNLEAVQEASANLEQQLLAERAKVDALIAEIDEIRPHPFQGNTLNRSEVMAILDKLRTK